MNLFSRLAGLETEYAVRCQPDGEPNGHSTRDVYSAIVAELQRSVLTVPAQGPKDGVFLGNGGAVWFELVHVAGMAGLIEGATPECRSPRALVAHQRAQDKLLGAAARNVGAPGSVCLIKNDRDGRGHTYGAQESYEVEIGRGWELWAWRAGLALLTPLVLCSWIGLVSLLLALITLLFLGLGLILFTSVVSTLIAAPGDERSAADRFGDRISAGGRNLTLALARIESVIALAIFAPLAGGLWALAKCVAFRRTIRGLLPFLASRPVISGAGLIENDGSFHLSDKAGTRSGLIGFYCLRSDRTVFSLGHFLKAMLFRSWRSWRDFSRPFARRQRLQVCLGDSNMCQEAEYLRVGTTLLVLDALDAGYFDNGPRLKRPLAAIRAINADPTLTADVEFKDGRRRTALEIQRYYLDGCRRFVEERSRRHPDLDQDAERTNEAAAPEAEAREILALWERALDDLEESPRRLIGRLDWVTKQALMDDAGEELSWEALKKIDIKYHELSSEGYFHLLEQGGGTERIVSDDDVDRAARTPPADTPARLRAHYIREFSGGDEPLTADWTKITLGRGRTRRSVELSQRT